MWQDRELRHFKQRRASWAIYRPKSVWQPQSLPPERKHFTLSEFRGIIWHPNAILEAGCPVLFEGISRAGTKGTSAALQCRQGRVRAEQSIVWRYEHLA